VSETPSACAVVLGQGSIGARHARLLVAEGMEVRVVSRHAHGAFGSTRDAVRDGRPEYAVVATPTAAHAASLAELASAGFSGTVLVEKPIVAMAADLPELDAFAAVHVAYNLRFHPVVRELRRRLAGETVVAANVFAGSWLPDWRPERDLRDTSSARRSNGGGVLRDMSHELDYAAWIFGPLIADGARGGRLGALDLDVEDTVGMILHAPGCPLLMMHLTYLDHHGARRLRVTTRGRTIDADLVRFTLSEGDRTTRFDVDWDATYVDLHRAARAGSEDLCSVPEALATVELLQRVESWLDQPGSIGSPPD
jgi:predicted dehydrogenase